MNKTYAIQREDMEDKERDRVNDFQKATSICDELQMLHIEKTTEAIGFAPSDNPEERNEKIEVSWSLYCYKSVFRNFLSSCMAYEQQFNCMCKKQPM